VGPLRRFADGGPGIAMMPPRRAARLIGSAQGDAGYA
jgi:hypothetical protein